MDQPARIETETGTTIKEVEPFSCTIVSILEAATFAATKHSAQRRKGVDSEPYINHPIEVALLTSQAATSTPDTVIAALLHDTVEDTDTSLADIFEQFGNTIMALVAEVTDDKSLPKSERKRLQVAHAPSLSQGAQNIKLADKIANLWSLETSPPMDWTLPRITEYVNWSFEVVAGLQTPDPYLMDRFMAVYDAMYLKRFVVRSKP